MMTAIDFFKNKAGSPDYDPEILTKDIQQSNSIRALIIMVFSILISGSIIISYSQKLNIGSPIEISWRESVILLNKWVASIFILLTAIEIFLYKIKKSHSVSSFIIITAVFVIIPLWGAIGSILDQKVNASIISFFLVCVVISVGLLIKPWVSLICFAITYAVFYYGIAYTQLNPEILSFNRTMAFYCIATSFGLSIFFWRNNLIRRRQNQTILKQKKELENNYNLLVESSGELKTAVATKDKFFSILGHDLRGPLTATLSLTQMMNEDVFENEKEEKDKAMKLIEGGLQNIIKLLEDLLLWSGTQTNSINFTPENLRMDEVVKNNIKLLELTATKKGIELISHVNEALWIYADKNMLNTILRNLLSNAIKFSNPQSSIDVFAEVSLDHKTGENIITVAVNDHGVGINEKTLQNLFKIDQKITTLGTNKETGTGLGLTLCKELAEKHNGFISVESKPGQGSKFMIHFPAK